MEKTTMEQREIKFRAFDTVLKVMEPQFDNWIDFEGNYWTSPDLRHNTPNQEIVRGHNYILLQYTGLKDKEGVEIFEGDIVKDSELTYIVRFGECLVNEVTFNGFYLQHPEREDYNGPFCKDDCQVLKVIGSIYTHPQLLEK
jgi:uncharacterized phage protein (TIGR01671 family)